MLLPTPRNPELELWDEAADSLEKLLETMLKKGNLSFLCIHHALPRPCLPACLRLPERIHSNKTEGLAVVVGTDNQKEICRQLN